MVLVEKAKVVHECMICKSDIVVGQPYLQGIIHKGAGMAIVGVHADHIAHDKKNLINLRNRDVRIINKICDTSVELVEAGAGILEAIKEAKKIHGWSDWL